MDRKAEGKKTRNDKHLWATWKKLFLGEAWKEGLTFPLSIVPQTTTYLPSTCRVQQRLRTPRCQQDSH